MGAYIWEHCATCDEMTWCYPFEGQWYCLAHMPAPRGDGITEDTVAIKAALDRLSPRGLDGGGRPDVRFLPPHAVGNDSSFES